jgi:hypothetical protein
LLGRRQGDNLASLPAWVDRQGREPVMINNAILLPMFAMVLLTIVVWFIMYRKRIGHVRQERINPQDLADASEAKQIMKPVQAPANNFANLFEVPVLFYAAVLTAYVTHADSWLILILFWIFVVLRYAHSYIHLTSNIVLQRFRVYGFSCLALWLAWIALAFENFF